MPKLVTVDDRNSRVTYNPRNQWWPETEFGRTITSTWDYGSTATLKFSGTSVRVIGLVHGIDDEDDDAVGSSYRCHFAVDGGHSQTITRTGAEQWVVDEVFYSVNGLSASEHTLVITYRGEGKLEFELDRIEYMDLSEDPTTAPAPTTSRTSTTSSTTRTVADAPPPTTATADPSPTPVPSPATTDPPSNGDSEPTTTPNRPDAPNDDDEEESPDSETSSTSVTRSRSGAYYDSFTKSLVDVTTTDGEGNQVTVTQTQYLKGGQTYTTEPAPSISGAGALDGASGGAQGGAESTSKPVPLGAIIGSVLGAVLVVGLIIICLLFRRKRQRIKREATQQLYAHPHPGPSAAYPGSTFAEQGSVMPITSSGASESYTITDDTTNANYFNEKHHLYGGSPSPDSRARLQQERGDRREPTHHWESTSESDSVLPTLGISTRATLAAPLTAGHTSRFTKTNSYYHRGRSSMLSHTTGSRSHYTHSSSQSGSEFEPPPPHPAHQALGVHRFRDGGPVFVAANANAAPRRYTGATSHHESPFASDEDAQDLPPAYHMRRSFATGTDSRMTSPVDGR